MWSALATLVPSILALLGFVFVVLKWIGKVDANTKATEKLTDAFESFSDRVSLRIDDHEVRIRVLESKDQK